MDALEEAVLLVDDDVELARLVSEELPGVLGADAGFRDPDAPFLYLGEEELEGHGGEPAKQRFAVIGLRDLPDRIVGRHVGIVPREAVLPEFTRLYGLVFQSEARILRIPVQDQCVLSGGSRRSEGSVQEGEDAKGGKGLGGFQ